jgi:hypothetical protein
MKFYQTSTTRIADLAERLLCLQGKTLGEENKVFSSFVSFVYLCKCPKWEVTEFAKIENLFKKTKKTSEIQD